MRAIFYGGPADGAEVVLHEPIPAVVRLPLDVKLVDVALTEARAVQDCQLDGLYDLELTAQESGQVRPVRHVRNGRPVVRYDVRVPRKRPATA